MKDRIAQRSKARNYTESRLPEFTKEEIEYIKGTHDFFGINVYTTTLAKPKAYDLAEGDSFMADAGVQLSQDEAWDSSASDWLKVRINKFRPKQFYKTMFHTYR